jgi:hypothetical protein
MRELVNNIDPRELQDVKVSYRYFAQDDEKLPQIVTGEMAFHVLRFVYNTTQIELLDVGSIEGERKKWIHMFDRCRVILFGSALTGFDETIPEEEYANSLQADLDLFGEICNLPFFQRSHILLFLSKKDLFQEKIQSGLTQGSPVQLYFGTTLEL